MTARTAGVVVLAGVLGWVGWIWLASRMLATTPPTAAFDLELLLRAGRDVAAGRSPYDPAIVAGAAPVAERLFYSYPPVVAQALAPFAGVPSSVMFVAWTAGAVAAFVCVTVALGRRLAPDLRSSPVAVASLAVTPLLFPFAIGLLFGNLDVFFPALYGLLLLAFLPNCPPGSGPAGAAATAVAALAKLHPASLGLWLLVRARNDRRARRVLILSIGVGLAILAVSLATLLPAWRDYVAVVRAGSSADLVDPRNGGPAAQIALLFGGSGAGGESLARSLQVPVTLIALVATAIVAWRGRDHVESLAWAAAASLVILPVTWYHYPSALMPFAAAALFRSTALDPRRATRVRGLVVAGAVVAAAAIAVLPLMYVAIGLVLVAARESAPPTPALATAPAPA